MKTLVLSSVTQISSLIDNNPLLLNVVGLAPLKPVIDNLKKPKSKCEACNRKNNTAANARPQIEMVLSNLSTSDYEEIKTLLNLDQLCYYQKITGKIVKTCI